MRLADRRCYLRQRSAGVVPLVLARFVEVPVASKSPLARSARVRLFFVDGPRGLTRAARQELLDRSKAGRVWRRRRIADRRCYPISV